MHESYDSTVLCPIPECSTRQRPPGGEEARARADSLLQLRPAWSTEDHGGCLVNVEGTLEKKKGRENKGGDKERRGEKGRVKRGNEDLKKEGRKNESGGRAQTAAQLHSLLWGPLSLADGGEGGVLLARAVRVPTVPATWSLQGILPPILSPPEAGAGAPDSRFSQSAFSSHAGTQAQSRGASTPAHACADTQIFKGRENELDDAGRLGQGSCQLPQACAREFNSCSKVASTEDPEASSPTGPHLILPCSSCILNKVEMIEA